MIYKFLVVNFILAIGTLLSSQSFGHFCPILERSLCAASCRGNTEDVNSRVKESSADDRVCALSLADSSAIQNLILAAGVSVNTTSQFYYERSPAGRTALFRIISRNRQDLFDNLLRAGIDVNLADDTGRTPLMQAAANGRVEMARALIAAKANVNAKDRDGNTALSLLQNHIFIPNRGELIALLQSAGAVSAK